MLLQKTKFIKGDSMNIRNLWRKAYKEGRLNDIPEHAREHVKKVLSGQEVSKEQFSQFIDEELEDLNYPVEAK